MTRTPGWSGKTWLAVVIEMGALRTDVMIAERAAIFAPGAAERITDAEGNDEVEQRGQQCAGLHRQYRVEIDIHDLGEEHAEQAERHAVHHCAESVCKRGAMGAQQQPGAHRHGHGHQQLHQ